MRVSFFLQDFHARLHQDFVELRSVPNKGASVASPAGTPGDLPSRNNSTSSASSFSNGKMSGSGKGTRPKSAYINGAIDASSDDLKSPTGDKVTPVGGARKPRPVSAEIHRDNRVSPIQSIASSSSDSNTASSGGSYNNQLMLLMYIIGGREVGQVTVFKRPISIWRLDLTKTF